MYTSFMQVDIKMAAYHYKNYL